MPDPASPPGPDSQHQTPRTGRDPNARWRLLARARIRDDYVCEHYKHQRSTWERDLSREEFLQEYYEHVQPEPKESKESGEYETPADIDAKPCTTSAGSAGASPS